MLTKIITNTDEFHKLKNDWERLQEQDPSVTYYSTFEFVEAWWNVYKENRNIKLFIICVYKNNETVGIAPFIIQRKRKKIISWNELNFIGKGDFLGVLVDRSGDYELTVIKDIFNCIEENTRLWDRVKLTHINSNCLLANFLFKQGKYNDKFKYLIESPYLNFKKYNCFEEYKKKFVSSSSKKYKNKLMREHNYTFRVIKNSKENNVFDKISELHKKTQDYLIKEEGRTDRRSLYEDERTHKYLRDIYQNSERILTFLMLDQSDNIIIYDTCYLYKNILHSWNTAYDPKYTKYNVGRIMNYEIMQYIFENAIADKFDFGAGRYSWKFEWTNEFNLVYQLDLWNEVSRKARLLGKIFKLIKSVN